MQELISALAQLLKEELGMFQKVFPFTIMEGGKIWSIESSFTYDGMNEANEAPLNFNDYLGNYLYFRPIEPAKYSLWEIYETEINLSLRLVACVFGRDNWEMEKAFRTLFGNLEIQSSQARYSWERILEENNLKETQLNAVSFRPLKAYLDPLAIFQMECPNVKFPAIAPFLPHSPKNQNLFALDLEIKLQLKLDCEYWEAKNCCE